MDDVPPGALHPRRIMKGVVSGVRDYGNRMGIPTSNGSVLFDKRYVGNPIVYCGTLDILPKACSFKKVSDGDVIVVVGGRTESDVVNLAVGEVRSAVTLGTGGAGPLEQLLAAHSRRAQPNS